MTYSSYESCTKCAGKAQPGAVNLLKYVMNKYDYTDSLGIYNCRYISGTTTLSNHSCGCAVDIFIPHDGWGNPRTGLGAPVVRFLDSISSTIGLTEQIYARVRYSSVAPRGRAYGGVHPHHDHIHLSITKAKGRSLTYAQIEAADQTGEEEDMSLPVGKHSSNEDIRKRQQRLSEAYGLDLAETGDWDSATQAAVKARLQKYTGYDLDDPDNEVIINGRMDNGLDRDWVKAIAGSGGSSVDAYTKAQSDARYPRKGEKRSITL